MSKRFGRNQKRKLKMLLEQAEARQGLLEEQKGWLENANEKALDLLDMVRRINPHFPALEEVQEIYDQVYCRSDFDLDTSFFPTSGNALPTKDAVTLTYIDLNQLEIDLRASQDFRNCVRFVSACGDKALMYSKEGLRYENPERLHRELLDMADAAIREFVQEVSNA